MCAAFMTLGRVIIQTAHLVNRYFVVLFLSNVEVETHIKANSLHQLWRSARLRGEAQRELGREIDE